MQDHNTSFSLGSAAPTSQEAQIYSEARESGILGSVERKQIHFCDLLIGKRFNKDPILNKDPIQLRMLISIELRNRIYRYLFRRPIGIQPCNDYIDSSERGVRFGYRLERFRQDYRNNYIPRSNGEALKVELSWTSDPTEQQLRQINDGIWHQRESRTAPESGEIACWANRRSETRVDILCKKQLSVYGLMGIPMLRTCKKLNEGGTAILYGENKFVFNSAGSHQGNELEKSPNLITGYRDTADQVALAGAIELIFDKSKPHSSLFVIRDPLLGFMRRIGRRDAYLIKNIKLEGPMKTASAVPPPFPPIVVDISLAHTLSVYTAFLGQVCDDLREVTLQIEKTDPGYDGYPLSALKFRSLNMTDWDDDPANRKGVADQRGIHEIAKNLVHGLPNLRKLRLGEDDTGTCQTNTKKMNYAIPFTPHGNVDIEAQKANEWEGGFEWMDFVDERE